MATQITRRAVVAGMTALPVAAFSSTNPHASTNPHELRLGAPIFLKSDDPAALAREHRRLGYRAAYCPPVELRDKERIQAIEKAYKEQGVVISEVGAWKNLLDPDSDKRHQNLNYVTERCALADAVGARCCVDIAGSYNPSEWYGPHPKNLSAEFFDATVENCRHIIDTVKPTRTKFTIEMMGWNIPDGPDSYLQLIRAVDRPAFGVHMDVCNVVNSPGRFYNNSEFIAECFQKLGLWVISCHAKDLQWITELNVHFLEVIPGRGQIDYRSYLTSIQQWAPNAPLMIEHLKTADEYTEAANYIRSTAQKANVPIMA